MRHYPNPVVVVYSTCLRAQTASIAAVTMKTAMDSNIPAEDGNLFRVSVYLLMTQVGSAGTVKATIIHSDDATNDIATDTATINLNTLGAKALLDQMVEVKAGGLIKFSTTVAGATGSPQYLLAVVLELLK